ncbi:unnamed protein product, partial [Echinostoma caproni]|uniref:Histidine kinase n=1 Tax=Echinostoma caproni TaxID=27848 RepID=A0A183AGA1_9TREM
MMKKVILVLKTIKGNAAGDFSLERQVLAERVYPELREYTREQYGLELQIIDPRPQNKTLLLESVNYREFFIEQCRKFCKSTADCCPVILFGQKLGLPLLPTRIPASIWDLIMNRAGQKRANPLHLLVKQLDFDHWYGLDKNGLPEPQRVLKSLDQLYPGLLAEDFPTRRSAYSKWNEDRDNLVRFLYYSASLCVQEDLLTSETVDKLFVGELSTTIHHALDHIASQDAAHNAGSYGPIALMRSIIDVDQFKHEAAGASDYLDLLPTLFRSEKNRMNPQIDSFLMEQLVVLNQYVNIHIKNGICKTSEHLMKVLWRNPSGIDRKFHADYLDQFVDEFKKLAFDAIDIRAKAKLTALNQTIERISQPNGTVGVTTNALEIPVSSDIAVIKARLLQQSIRAWDQAWNSAAGIERLAPLAKCRENEIQILVDYLMNEHATKPLLVYSVNNTDKNGCNDTANSDDLASAVACAAFLEAHRTLSESAEAVLIGHNATKPMEVSRLLAYLADQLSVALCQSRDKFDSTTLSTLLNSVGVQLSSHSKRPVLFILAGVHLIVDSNSNNFNVTTPSIALTEASHLPHQLHPGVKLILAGKVQTFSTIEGASTSVLLPKTCLTLEITPPSVRDAISVCLGALTENSRILTQEQITELYQALDQLGSRRDLLNCSYVLTKSLLCFVRSDDRVESTQIVQWVDDNNKTLSAFISCYSPHFSPRIIDQIIRYLYLASSSMDNTSPAGLTETELDNLLVLDQQFHPIGTNPNSVNSTETSIILDSAERALIWSALRQSPILQNIVIPYEQYLDGYLCLIWNSPLVAGGTNLTEEANIMADYFLNTWSLKLKASRDPNVDIALSIDRTKSVLKQNIYLGEKTHAFPSLGLEYNVRYLRQVGFCLLRTGELTEWANHTWFSFKWLHSTMFAAGMWELLNLFPKIENYFPNKDSTKSLSKLQFQSGLVYEALANSAPLLQGHPNLLAAEIIGQLSPFVPLVPTSQSHKTGIELLVDQCKTVAPWYNPIYPLHAYSDIPGSPMVGRLSCPSPLLDMCIQSGSESNDLLVKLDHDPIIYRFACSAQKRLPNMETGHGRMFLCPNVYQMDAESHGRVPMIGQINTGLWIAASCGLIITDLKAEVLALDLTDEHVGLIVSTKRLLGAKRSFSSSSSSGHRTDSASNSSDTSLTEHLAAGTSNHIVIFELTTGKPVQILSPFPRANFITLGQLEKNEGQNKNVGNSAVFFTNSNRVLLGFRTSTGEQLFALTLEIRPVKLLPSWIGGGHNLFLQFEHSAKLVQLKLNCNGEVSKSITISFENSLAGDRIVDFLLANSNPYLLIHAHTQILVYDFHADQLVTHIFPPVGMPHTIRLPNEAPQPLSFTAVGFALHDRVVVACIFRTVILWDIRLNRLLTNFYAPVGSLTRFVTDSTQRLLIGYSKSAKELYMWDLTTALTSIAHTYNEALLCPIDRLSKAVTNILPSQVSQFSAIAHCAHSDELGAFDCSTGRMTDLFTHEGQVVTATLSACGQYVLVGLKLPPGYESQPVNVIWSLQSRALLCEFGIQVGFHLSGGSTEAKFLQIQEIDAKTCELYAINVNELDTGTDSNPVRVECCLTLPHLETHVTPFWAADDQCLLALVSDQLDSSRNVHNKSQLVLMVEKQGEWSISYPIIDSHEEQLDCKPHILS